MNEPVSRPNVTPLSRPNVTPLDCERVRIRATYRETPRCGVRRLFVCLASCVAGIVILSATASAHDFGNGGGPGGAETAFAIVLALPTLAGLAGGVAAVRYRRFRGSTTGRRESSIVVGFLLVGLGGTSILSAMSGLPWLSVAGGTIGALVALRFVRVHTHSDTGFGNHAGITFGAISTHRVLEGVVVGTLYSAGAAIGLLGAVVLAAHTALETAAVGGLYAGATRRIWIAGAIVFVQAGYVVGAVASLAVAVAVPTSVQTITLALVGGALLIVGIAETKHSVGAEGPAPSY